jgi:hypothetical protein
LTVNIRLTIRRYIRIENVVGIDDFADIISPTSTVLRQTVAEIRGIAADAISCTVLWC